MLDDSYVPEDNPTARAEGALLDEADEAFPERLGAAFQQGGVGHGEGLVHQHGRDSERLRFWASRLRCALLTDTAERGFMFTPHTLRCGTRPSCVVLLGCRAAVRRAGEYFQAGEFLAAIPLVRVRVACNCVCTVVVGK